MEVIFLNNPYESLHDIYLHLAIVTLPDVITVAYKLQGKSFYEEWASNLLGTLDFREVQRRTGLNLRELRVLRRHNNRLNYVIEKRRNYMKNGKRLTVKQKKILTEGGINADDYLISKKWYERDCEVWELVFKKTNQFAMNFSVPK